MNILLTGSIAYDYLMTFPGYFRDHILPEHLETISLSFLVNSMIRQRGGTAPNIAYTMSLLNKPACLMATVGEDFQDYRHWLEEHGIDTRWVREIPGEVTASFFCNTDQANNQIASFYPGAMSYACQISLTELGDSRPDLVVISPNDPEAMKYYVQECKQFGYPYLYDPSQQIVRFTPDELRFGITGAHSLFVNEYEFALVQNSTGLSSGNLRELVGFMVVTHGKDGAVILTEADEVHVPTFPAEKIEDPTGVGDAFRGGFLVAYDQGMDWRVCGLVGALAATYCLEQRGPQGHTYTPEEFVQRFRTRFDDGGQLDRLVQRSEKKRLLGKPRPLVSN
jgi:adenosine kinase